MIKLWINLNRRAFVIPWVFAIVTVLAFLFLSKIFFLISLLILASFWVLDHLSMADRASTMAEFSSSMARTQWDGLIFEGIRIGLPTVALALSFWLANYPIGMWTALLAGTWIWLSFFGANARIRSLRSGLKVSPYGLFKGMLLTSMYSTVIALVVVWTISNQLGLIWIFAAFIVIMGFETILVHPGHLYGFSRDKRWRIFFQYLGLLVLPLIASSFIKLDGIDGIGVHSLSQDEKKIDEILGPLDRKAASLADIHRIVSALSPFCQFDKGTDPSVLRCRGKTVQDHPSFYIRLVDWRDADLARAISGSDRLAMSLALLRVSKKNGDISPEVRQALLQLSETKDFYQRWTRALIREGRGDDLPSSVEIRFVGFRQEKIEPSEAQ